MLTLRCHFLTEYPSLLSVKKKKVWQNLTQKGPLLKITNRYKLGPSLGLPFNHNKDLIFWLLRDNPLPFIHIFILSILQFPSCFAVLSVAEVPSLQRSCWGSILFCHEWLPQTSSHQFDWPRWWCHPRGSPARLRSRAQSRTELYSTAQLQETQSREKTNSAVLLK